MVSITESKGPVHAGKGGLAGYFEIFSKQYRRPLFLCGIAVLGAVLYGYDGTYFTSILEMNKFKLDYGVPVPNPVAGAFPYEITSSDQSLFTSIVQAGEFVGALSAGFIGDMGGRKGAIAAALALVSLGVLLQMLIAGSKPLLTVGRLVLGSGVGVISNAVPLYLSEIPPVQIRGSIVSSWQLMLAIGQVIGACVGQGTKDITNTGSYRIPIAVNWAIVLILAAGLFIIPESPRWLVYKNRPDKAERASRSIFLGQADQETLVQEQLAIINQSRDEEVAKGGTESKWVDLIKNPVERRKLFCVVGILVGQQISGVQFIFSYTTTFMSNAGLTDPFIVTIIVDVVQVLGVLVSFLVVNRYGRRPLLLYTGAFMFSVLFACGCLGAKAGHGDFQAFLAANRAYGNAVAAMIILYVFAFNLAFGPLAWVVASELSTGRNRQKILAVGTACFWLAAFIVTFTLPYLFRKDEAGLGPMIGFIYCFGQVVAMLFIFFYLPETRGRTLEEINFLMEAQVPTREWASFDLAEKVALTEKQKASGNVEHQEHSGKKEENSVPMRQLA